MTLVDESLPAPPRKPLPPKTLENARIICSHCGVLNYRTITQAAFDEGQNNAFFCTPHCARQNRIAGLGRLVVKTRNAIVDLHKEGMTAREIADDLNLSPLAVAAFLMSRSHPAEGADITRHKMSIDRSKAVSKARKERKARKPVDVDDDIFSDESIERAAMMRNLNSDLLDD